MSALAEPDKVLELSDPKLIALVNADYVAENQIIPVAFETIGDKERVVVGYANPAILRKTDELVEKLGMTVRLVSYPSFLITDAIEKYYGRTVVKQTATIEIIGREEDSVITAEQEAQQTSAINQLVSAILVTAIDQRATDIHIKPTAQTSTVLFRIDGKIVDFTEQCNISRKEHAYVMRRIQSMCSSHIDVTNTRIPKDGSFQFQLKDTGDFIGCRISTIPVIYGEKMAKNQELENFRRSRRRLS